MSLVLPRAKFAIFVISLQNFDKYLDFKHKQDRNWILLGKLLTVNLCFVCVAADVLNVPPVSSLPPPVAPVRTAGGKALLENLYLPPLPPGVKLNSFASVHSSLHIMIATEDLKAGSERYLACDVRINNTATLLTYL